MSWARLGKAEFGGLVLNLAVFVDVAFHLFLAVISDKEEPSMIGML